MSVRKHLGDPEGESITIIVNLSKISEVSKKS